MRALGFGLDVLILSQGVQCPAKSLREEKRGFGLFPGEEPNAFGDEQLGLDLGTGPRGNLEEVAEFLGGVPREAFGDVGGDGDRCATELVAKREPLFRG